MAQVHRPLNTFALVRIVLTIVAAAWIGGCSSPEPYEPPRSAPSLPPSTPAPAPRQSVPPQSPAPHAAPRLDRAVVLSPASSSLVKQAHTQIAQGDLTAASSTLDRALRIEPNNPLLWIELGRLRLADSDPHQAEVCARKALALGSGSRAAQAQAGHLLADAYRAQGRNGQAREVENRSTL